MRSSSRITARIAASLSRRRTTAGTAGGAARLGAVALPPKADPRLRLSRSAPRSRLGAEATPGVDGIAGPIDADPEQVVFTQTTSSPVIGPARLIFKTGLILSLALLLIFYLEQNSRYTAVFGALAVIFFFLLLRLPSKNRERDGL